MIRTAMPNNVTSYVMRSDETAIKLFAEAGFDSYDFSVGCWIEWEKNPPFAVPSIDSPEFIERAKAIRKCADEAGIPCSSAHAPCFTASPDPENNERCFKGLVRCMEAAAIAGAEAIVVHPACYKPWAKNREEMMQINVDLYRRLMPYAEEYKIKVATENMIDWDGKGNFIPGAMGSAEEFIELLDRVDSEWLTVCYDLGHSSCAGVELPPIIRKLGKERLFMLHVHDNGLTADQHLVPYFGRIDFTGVIQALKDIEFDGILDFEVDYGRFPIKTIPTVIRLVSEVASDMKTRIAE